MAKSTDKLSKTLYVIKAFAILSVIAAHMTFSDAYPVAEIVRSTLGQIGVVIFFIISGYFYSRKPGDDKAYWAKKAKTLIVPWAILSTVVFALSAFIFGSSDNFLLDFIKNFFGIGTVYWYMTILLVMLILFRYFYNKEFILYISIGVSAVSIALSAFGLINYTVILNQYLNFFNWVGFFALGIILRKKNLLENLINWVATVVSFVGLTAFTVIAVVIGNSIEAYIDITSLFVELFGFVFFLNVSNFLANSKLLSDIGKKSFFIYLMHIQVVGAINTRLPYNALFFILRPFVGLMVCYIIAVVFKLILNKLKLNKYSFIFGLNR